MIRSNLLLQIARNKTNLYMDTKTQKELLKIVYNNYDEVSEKFSSTRKYVSKSWDELRQITDNIKDGDSVLDVGCGSGRLLELIGDKQVGYVGVDSSEKLLEEASNNYLGHRFIYGDILALGELSELNFDYVFAIAVIHHIPGNELRIKALKQIKNKIAKDGEAVISVWNLWSKAWAKKKFKQKIIKFALLKIIGKNKMDFGDVLFDWKNSQGERVSKRYYHAFTRHGLKRLGRKAGLRVKKIYKDKHNYYMILNK